MQPTVVTILSTNYAGSHFLSLLLGSHSQAVHLGELYQLTRGVGKQKFRCRHCVPPEKCPVIRGVHPERPATVYPTIFSNLRQDGAEKSVLIDASKRIDWAQRFLDDHSVCHKYIHLIRDPRALVRRWLLKHRRPQSWMRCRHRVIFRGHRTRWELAFRPQWMIHAYKWLDENLEIDEFLEIHALDHRVVTYRDLAIDTSSELGRLTSWIGLQPESQQIEYWTVQHHGEEKRDYEWIKQQRIKGHFDLRWKEFLSPEICEAVAREPELNVFFARHGLAVTENGLSRHQPAVDDAVKAVLGEAA